MEIEKSKLANKERLTGGEDPFPAGSGASIPSDQKPQPRQLLNESAERFLSAQADVFAGAKTEEKIGLLRSE